MRTTFLPPGRGASNQYQMRSPQFRDNVSSRPVVRFVSPGTKINPPSPSMARKQPAQYITHLIPNHKPFSSPTEDQQSSYAFQPYHSSHIKHYFTYNSDHKSNNSNSRLHKNNLMNNTGTVASLGVRSRGNSGVSNKKSILIQQSHKNQYCPPSPTHIRRLEPIRRVSRHGINGSKVSEQRSNRSSSQHNINIIVETDLSRDPNQLPPKITVQHVMKGAYNKGSSLILKNPQINSLLSNPGFCQAVQKSIHENRPQTDRGQPTLPAINFMTPVKTQNISMPPQPLHTFRPPSTYQQKPVLFRRHSLSMDSKNYIRSNEQSSTFFIGNDSVIKNNKVIQHQLMNNNPSYIQPVTLHQSEETPKRVLQHPYEQVIQYRAKESQIKYKGLEKDKHYTYRQQKESNEVKKDHKECINQYYGLENLQQQDPSIPSSIDQTKRFQMYRCKQKISQRALINEIFENQTHKALLKMEKIKNRSLERTFKRHRY